jgi:hypothetical protein
VFDGNIHAPIKKENAGMKSEFNASDLRFNHGLWQGGGFFRRAGKPGSTAGRDAAATGTKRTAVPGGTAVQNYCTGN